MKTNIVTLRLVALLILFICSSAANLFAGEPIIWEINSRAELLKGEAHGVSVTDTGALTLAPRFDLLFDTEQPYIWSTAIDVAGTLYVGTGHDGKLFRLTPDGKSALFFKSSELDVTAVAVAQDGAVFAATSPDGKVYRITTDGKSEVYFDPADKYIWSLAILPDGSLAVGTGDTGKLYRVRTAGAQPTSSLLLKTNQTHVMSLIVDKQGDLIAGTDPGSLVLRISGNGKAFGLYDSALREIHALSAAPDGSIYALALSETASTTKNATAGATDASTATVTTTASAEDTNNLQATATRSRNDLTNARSAVFHILPDGVTDVIWSSTSIAGFALAAGENGVLLGTSDKGRIYSITNDGRDTLLLQSTEGQISTLVTRGLDVYAGSSNQGQIFRYGESVNSEGSYESPVRDAKLVASWGRVWWRGQGAIEIQTRSGNSNKPDATWSDWSSYDNENGSQIASPKARFIQWRAMLRSARNGSVPQARLNQVSLAYLPRNVAPEVLSITVLPPGVALQPQLQI